MIQLPCVGEQEADQVGDVGGGAEAAEGLGGQSAGADRVVHPAGVDRARVDHVRAEAAVAELMGGGEDQAIQSALGRAVREVADGVVAGQGDDAAAGVGQLAGERGGEQPGRADVDRVVPIEALDRGVEHARSRRSRSATSPARRAGRPARRPGPPHRRPGPGPPDPPRGARPGGRCRGVSRPADRGRRGRLRGRDVRRTAASSESTRSQPSSARPVAIPAPIPRSRPTPVTSARCPMRPILTDDVEAPAAGSRRGAKNGHVDPP